MGCNKSDENKTEVSYLNTPDLYQLEAEAFNTDKIDIYRLTNVSLVDSLVVLTSLTNSQILSLYSLDGEYFSSYGNFGKGPNEITSGIPRIYSSLSMNGESYLELYDLNQRKFELINLNETNNTGVLKMDDSIILPNSLFPVIKPYFVSDNTLVAYYNDIDTKMVNGKTGLVLYNRKNKEYTTATLPVYKFDDVEREHDYNYMFDYQSINAWHSDLNNSRNRIVLSNELTSLIVIYHLVEDYLMLDKQFYYRIESDEPKFNYSQFKNNDGLARKVLYTQATNEFIYLNVSKGSLEGVEYGQEKRELVKLDYDGKLIARYKLPDDLMIEMFTIDEQNAVFYGIDVSKDLLYKLSVQE